MERDLAMVKGLSDLSKEFVCESEAQLLKEAPVYIMHELYKF
jgi:hypothetical protein